VSAVAVVTVIVMLIAISRAVFGVLSFPVRRPSDKGDNGGSKLQAVLGEFVLDSWRYLVKVFAHYKSTILESAQSIR
jgi:hypothetical protein